MFDRIRLLILTDSVDTTDPTDGLGPLRPVCHLDPEQFVIEAAALHAPDPAHNQARTVDPVRCLNLPRSGLRYNPLAHIAVHRLLTRLHPDAICLVGAGARLLGIRAAERLGIAPRIAYVDDMGFDLTLGLLDPLRWANAGTSRFVVSSYALAQRLVRQERADRTRIDIIPHGVDCSEYRTRTPDSVTDAKHSMGLSFHEPVVVMAADFLRLKDQGTMLEAAVQLKPLVPNARYVLLGQGTPGTVTELRGKIAEIGLAERVIVESESEAVPRWLQAADIGVLTSYSESCSPALLAYMAAGLPIVAANTGGNAELIEHNASGYLHEPKDHEQLAMYMMLLLLSPELSSRFGQAARKRARQHFSLDEEARRWSDYFSAVTLSTA